MACMVFLDELKPGMVLAYPILSDRGLLLLSEGVILGGEHLRMLRANGVLYAHVREPEPRPETAVPPLLRPSSMDRAVQVLKGAFDSAAQAPSNSAAGSSTVPSVLPSGVRTSTFFVAITSHPF